MNRAARLAGVLGAITWLVAILLVPYWRPAEWIVLVPLAVIFVVCIGAILTIALVWAWTGNDVLR